MDPYNITINLVTDIETKPEDLILFFTLIITAVIGLVSILLTFLTLRAQRRHDELSIRPIGNFHFYWGPDGTKLSICNSGIGPMIINSLSILDNNGNKKGELSDFFQPAGFIEWLPRGAQGEIASLKKLKGHALVAGNEITFFTLKLDPTNKEHAQKSVQFRNFVKTLTFKLEYEDIYGNKQRDATTKYEPVIEP
jgi:hypothetical protein